MVELPIMSVLPIKPLSRRCLTTVASDPKLRRFAAHVGEPMVIVFVEGRVARLAVTIHDHALFATLLPRLAIHIPADAVDVDLRKDTLAFQTGDRRAERLHAFARRPEIGVVGVVRVAVPPIPVESHGNVTQLFLQPLDRRQRVFDKPAVPDPHADLAERVHALAVRVPSLSRPPLFVDLPRLEPPSRKRRETAGVRDAVGG